MPPWYTKIIAIAALHLRWVTRPTRQRGLGGDFPTTGRDLGDTRGLLIPAPVGLSSG
jgi:hypothetical protein